MDDRRLRFLLKVIAVFTPNEHHEEVLGDFEELYVRRMKEGRSLLPFVDALSAFRRLPRQRQMSLSAPLASSYARQTLRELRSGRSFGVINIAGLAVGIAATLLIGLYIHDEWRHDRDVPGAESIYRVVSDEPGVEGRIKLASVHMPLLQELPENSIRTRYLPHPSLVSTDDGRAVQEEGFVFADSGFFDVFRFPFIAGDPTRALDTPNAVVITRSSALRWFGSTDVIGRSLTWKGSNSSSDLVITGVLRDPTHRTHLTFDMVANLEMLLAAQSHMNSWYWPPVYSYVRLNQANEYAAVNARLRMLTEERMPQLGLDRTYGLQPFADIWLRSARQNEPVPVGSMLMIKVLFVTALLILLVACVNFVNLMTAQGMARMKEAAVRRALGAFRQQLVHQFLGTTIVASAIASIAGICVTAALLPWFGVISGRSLSLAPLWSLDAIMTYAAFTLLLGLLTGLYPAITLSGKASPSRSSQGTFFRRTLIVFQFGIACSLVFASVMMSRQMQMLLSDGLGFNKEHVVAVQLREQKDQIMHASLADAWRQDIRITSVTASSGFPGLDGGIHDFQVVLADAPSDTLEIDVLTTEPGFAETYGLEILEGRTFDEDRVDDLDAGFLINEAAARQMGLEQAVGTELTLFFYERGPVWKTGVVIGVVRDFQYHSLRRETSPILVHIRKESFYNDFMSVRLSGNDVAGALSFMEQEWETFNPERPFEFVFIDDVIDAMYRSDVRLTGMIRLFAAIGLALSALGIFSVAAFTMLRRRREIGIRKALGAGTLRILRTMSTEFAVLVALACIISIPLTALVLQRWLGSFADHAPINASGVSIAVLVTLMSGLLAVFFIILRATKENPSVTLRSEQ